MKSTRIATVKATGRRYVVLAIDCSGPRNVVQCYGEVIRYRGLRATHAHDVLKFDGSEVTIAIVPRTAALLDSLFEETIAARVAGGAEIVARSATKVRLSGSPLDRGRTIALQARPGPATAARLLDLASEAERKGLAEQAAALLEMAADAECAADPEP